jgi:carboxyl-terminal processing protease
MLEIIRLLNEAVNICNLFVPKTRHCYYKIKIEKHNSTYKTTKDPVDTEIPLIILVNGQCFCLRNRGWRITRFRSCCGRKSQFEKDWHNDRLINLEHNSKLHLHTPSGRCKALDYSKKDKMVSHKTEEKNFNAFKHEKEAECMVRNSTIRTRGY